jgi:hypothetical protein
MLENEQVAESLFDRWSRSSARTPKRPEYTPPATVAVSPEEQSAEMGFDPETVDEIAGRHLSEVVGSRPLVWLSDTHTQVMPGQSARIKVNVRNVGSVVETYNITILGPANSWVQPVPNEISLFPGDEGSITVMVRPPKTSTLTAGRYVVGVKATSQVRWTERTVAEFTVDVEPYHNFKSMFSRSTLDMRRRAQTYIQINNDGNSSVEFNLSVIDPDGRLRVKCDKDDIVLKPGEPTWVNITVKAHLKFFGRPKNYNLVSTVTPLRDTLLGEEITEVKPSIQHGTVIQKPLFHLKLGFFGRIMILLAILALIATFLFARWQENQKPSVTGAPATPAALKAAMDGGNVVLTWNPSSGASGYSIYAIGAAGNPTSDSAAGGASAAASPSASAAASPSTEASASASATPAASASATPSASASAVGSTGEATAAVVARGITEFTPADSYQGITFVNVVDVVDMTKKPKLRVKEVASVMGGESTTKPAASPTPTPSVTKSASSSASPTASSSGSSSSTGDSRRDPYASDSALPTYPSGSLVPSAATSDLTTPVCLDCTFVASVPSGSTRYVVKSPPTGINACYRIAATAGTSNESLYSPPACVEVPGTEDAASAQAGGADGSAAALPPCPPVSIKAKARSTTSLALTWSAATEALTSSSTKEPTCEITAKITGWEIQKKIGSGWADISPQPAVNDTATEVTGLAEGTKYCYRMRSVAGESKSDYTTKFCGTTAAPAAAADPAPSPSTSASTSASSTATPTASPSAKVIVLAP